MAKENKMICTEEQCNVLEELFVEMLLWLVDQLSVNPIAVWKTCAILKLPNRGYVEGSCVWSSMYNCMTKSSSDFTSATEHVSDEPRLFNGSNTSFGTGTKTSQYECFEELGNLSFNHILLGHEKQGVL